MIAAHNLVKTYRKNGRPVLNDVSLTFASGELNAVMGESGSGKSTLLAVLAGILRPDSGRVETFGTDLYSLSDAELSGFRRDRIGYVPQSNVFLKNYTVIENLVTPFAAKYDAGKLKERALSLLDELGVAELSQRQTFELSGGEQKRVALARAFMTDPEVIIADEPTTGLDASTGDIILRFLKKQADLGKTVVVATHDEHIRAYATGIKNNYH